MNGKPTAGIAWLVPVALGFAVGCGRLPMSPLAKAAAAGDALQVVELLDAGSDANDLGRTGLSPLMYAARGGHVAVVRALLERGASPDLVDRGTTGWTPLIHAIHVHHQATAVALLEGGAQPDVRVGDGETALLFAAAYGDTAIVRALLDKGADPRQRSADGATPLWAALGGGGLLDFSDGPAIGTCFPETAAVLLERAPDLKLPDGWPEDVLDLRRSPSCRSLVERLR